MCHEINDGAVIPFDKNFGGLIACVVFSCQSVACYLHRCYRSTIS